MSPNPGEDLRPIARAASGGELSRLYLAVQLAAGGEGERGRPTLVFDEVDAGIGGAEAAALGRKLRRLARGGQVLAVTHLPQVASHGDLHFRISKRVDGGRTFASVEALDCRAPRRGGGAHAGRQEGDRAVALPRRGAARGLARRRRGGLEAAVSPLRSWRFGEPVEPLVELVRRGGILAIPTESSYGLGVDPRSPAGVEAVFAAKGREPRKPLPVVAASLDQLRAIGIDPEAAEVAPFVPFWPAALSVVAPLAAPLPAAAGELGARGARARPRAAARPPRRARHAAHRHQRQPERRAADPRRRAPTSSALLDGFDAAVVDGGRLPGGPPSTLVELAGGELRVLRAGSYPMCPTQGPSLFRSRCGNRCGESVVMPSFSPSRPPCIVPCAARRARRGRRARRPIAALIAAFAFTAPLPAQDSLPLTDVRSGQRGYGLSVFTGTEPEKFEVEVLGVLRNPVPDSSYILARLTGRNLEETGVIAGMSGSPVYIDGQLAGAVSAAWPFSREAIALITPIGEMRRRSAELPAAMPVAAGDRRAAARDAARRTLPDRPPRAPPGRAAARALPSGATVGLQWSAAGFGGEALDLMRRALGRRRAGGRRPTAAPPSALVPGGAVAGVLVDGDLRLAVTGTVTERRGDEVLAFGHPFLGVGPVSLPMAPAEVLTVLPSQFSSFKIASFGEPVGAFDQDRQPGMRGRVGARAPMVPMTVEIEGRTFHTRFAPLPQVAPALVAITALGCLQTAGHVAGAQGFDLDATFVSRGTASCACARASTASRRRSRARSISWR